MDKRILHIHQDADGSIHAREFFDGLDGHKEAASGTPVRLGNSHAHQSELEELPDQFEVHPCLSVHLHYQRSNPLVGKLPNAGSEQLFLFRKDGERQCSALHTHQIGIHSRFSYHRD